VDALRVRADAAEAERDELKYSTAQRASKEKARVAEIDDLRDKFKDLRRRLAEAQEQAKKVKDAERALREVEEQAHAQVVQARADATAASHELKALREEAELFRSKRPLPKVEEKPEAPVPAPVPPPLEVKPAALVEAEERLVVERAHVTEALDRVASEHKRAQDALREAERLKAKISSSERVYLVQKGELEVWKDRFRTLEARMNALLRESDALRRGVVALEKRLPRSKVAEARAEAQASTETAEATEQLPRS
jgi:chromosome segregation ATPase